MNEDTIPSGNTYANAVNHVLDDQKLTRVDCFERKRMENVENPDQYPLLGSTILKTRKRTLQLW